MQDDEDDEDFEEPLTAIDAEPDQSPGLLGTLFGGLAAVVVIPLVLIMVIISTALPILVVAALIMGPGDTLNMVRAWIPGSGGETGSGTCEGFADCFDASNERGNRLYAQIEPVLKREVEDPVALRALSDDLRTGAMAQRLSSPPAEAVKLNNLLADIYILLAQITEAGVNGEYANMQAYDAEYRELVPQADAEDRRLRQACL